MEQLNKLISAKIVELEAIIEEARQYTVNVPEGSIRISRRGNKNNYYLRTAANKEKCHGGKYIRRQDDYIAFEILQNEYAKKVISKAQKELNALNSYIRNSKDGGIKGIYSRIPEHRQEPIKPIIMPDEEYLLKWEEEKFVGKDFSEDNYEIYTNRGERVRSKSEKIIADFLFNNNIPYKYEKPHEFVNYRGKEIKIYPDFTLLDILNRREIILEHFGLLDDPIYVENAISKVELYEENGYFMGDNLIVTYETGNKPLNTRILEERIKRLL